MGYTKHVYTGVMKNVTLTADGGLLERARQEFADLMKRLRNVQTIRRFSRDERNER